MSEENTHLGAASVASVSDRRDVHLRKFDIGALPQPTLLIGSGLANWDNVEHTPCRACHNNRLPRYAYCLVCDRWGYDELIGATPLESRLTVYPERVAAVTQLSDHLPSRRPAA